MLPSPTINIDDNEEALPATAITLSLLSPPTDNSADENCSQSSIKTKYYYHHKHHCFSDLFNDPILDDAVIYACNIPFQYNERGGRYTEFLGNL